MAQLIVVILDDLKHLPDLLSAWRAVGLPGATILESVGAYRAENWLGRAGLGALSHLFEADEVRRRTLLAVVDDKLVDPAVAEAERVIGGFSRPNSGLLIVVPITRVLGLKKAISHPAIETRPPALEPDWVPLRDRPVELAAGLLNPEPVAVQVDTPLEGVVRALMEHPSVRVACVMDEDGRLVGLITLRSLAENLFFHILPEESLSEITGLDDVMQFAERSRHRTALNAMQPPVWVRQGEPVKEAFRRMHEHDLLGLPIVDDQQKVVGYADILELMAFCSGHALDQH